MLVVFFNIICLFSLFLLSEPVEDRPIRPEKPSGPIPAKKPGGTSLKKPGKPTDPKLIAQTDDHKAKESLKKEQGCTTNLNILGRNCKDVQSFFLFLFSLFQLPAKNIQVSWFFPPWLSNHKIKAVLPSD